MNASYNKLETKHLPKAQIVYDRFHMQSQFGRDVLGVVRLNEARRHKAKEKEILADISDDTDKETMKSLKQEAKTVCSSKRITATRLSYPCHPPNQHWQARRLQQQDQGR